MTDFIDNPWVIGILVSMTGYLIGSVSFARILSRRITKNHDFGTFKFHLPGSDKPFESKMVSATALGMRHGKRIGLFTSFLDILKVALPTFLVRLLFPDQSFHLLTAIFGIVGHNYPLYYRFVGGRGDSPILGAMIVINWFGIFIVNGAAMILGYLTGSVLVMRLGGNVLCIFWFWIYFEDIYPTLFMIGANVLFWASTSRDLERFNRLIKENKVKINQEFMSNALLMGGGIGRFMDRYGLPALLKKIFGKAL